jgi:3-phenylpropionate/trans-cinnamate dioxygenase ferredoxin reductase subunit
MWRLRGPRLGGEARASRRRLLIIGGGAAGAAAAMGAGGMGAGGSVEVTLLSDEHPTPYSRPALMYIAMGDLLLRDAALASEERWGALGVRRVWGRAEGLELWEGGGGVASGYAGDGAPLRLEFDALIVATGSAPRRVAVPGVDPARALTFGDLSDLARLSRALPRARRAVVVGGGLVGAELAEVLTRRGCPVTLLVREPRYAPHALAVEESALVEEEIRARGVELRLGVGVEAVAPLLRSPDDLICLAVGSEPRSGLLTGAGLPLAETPSVGVWAAGDCVGIRGWAESWRQGERAGRAAVAWLCGSPAPPSPPLPPVPQVSRYFTLTHTRVGLTPAEEGVAALGGALSVSLERPRGAGRALVRVVRRGGEALCVSALGCPLPRGLTGV